MPADTGLPADAEPGTSSTPSTSLGDPVAPLTLARVAGPDGEVVLRRRWAGDDAVVELIVNGAFAMDSTETGSERALARLAYAGGPERGRMLVGGLGLGYTATEALELPLDRLTVVELEPALVRWAHERVTPELARLADEPRVTLVAADIRSVLSEGQECWDAIALDVDNGPDFLIHSGNATLYSAAMLRTAYGRLNPGGRLAIWCQGPAPRLLEILATIAPTAHEHLFVVTRGLRRFTYAICTLDRPAEKPTGARPAPPEAPSPGHGPE